MQSSQKGIVSFIVWRYLRFDPSQPFISIAAILAFLGVAVGVMVLIVAMAIMNGFDKEFREKLFVMNYPITIMPKFAETLHYKLPERLEEAFPEFVFSPYVRSQAMSRKGNLMEGNILFGVDFEKEKALNPVIKEAVTKQTYKPFDMVVGKSLADSFMLTDNEKLLLIFTTVQPAGLSFTPLMKRFTVADRFSSGLIAYDKAYIYTRIEDLRTILDLPDGVIHGIHVLSPDPMKDIKKIEEKLGAGEMAIGWWEQNSNFFSALELEKRALFLVLMLIILVASLNIISSLLMTVLNRRKEIALLLSLGASRKQVEKIFFYLGSIIGFGGIVVGLILGSVVLWALENFDIISLPADVYGSSNLPLDLSSTDLVAILLGAFVIVLLSSWYPAHKASKTDVLDTLRHE